VVGLGEPDTSVISIPINKRLRDARDKPISGDMLSQLLDFVREAPARNQGLEGVKLQVRLALSVAIHVLVGCTLRAVYSCS
jgi:hypothetical protein